MLSDTWNGLDADFFTRMHASMKGKIKTFTPLKPRPHQRNAILQAKEFFIQKNNSRGKLIFPCGSGKSLTGFWLTQELQSKKTLIAVPSLSLIKQTLEVYLREVAALKKKVNWLCICSDEGIGINDDVTILTENIGVPCQTNPDYIFQWLRENQHDELIIFTTYQSGKLIAEASKKLNFQFNVGIFDEAHKTVGSDKKLFSYLLFDANIDISKRIFMTATERFYSGTKDDVLSMDDSTIYGETFMHMSFKEAIQSDLLTDYKVVTIDVKKSEIAEFIRNNNLVELNDKWRKETEARSLAAMIALRKGMQKFPIRNAVSFHSSIDKAIRNSEIQEHITESYGYPDIESFTVSGKQATSLRNNIVQEFARSNGALITNARCLTEGVDVPNIDCIVFADPRKSRIDIVQALGRALRKKDNKQWGYVILPVIYDENTGEVDNENFSEIVSIVRSLASNDDRIIEYFKDRHDGDKHKNQKQLSEFQFDILSDYLDEATLKENLSIKLWEKLGKLSWMPFDQARNYVRGLKISSRQEWSDYAGSNRLPSNIPKSPFHVYSNDGWNGIADWLGIEPRTSGKTFMDFENARDFARSLGFRNYTQWRLFKDLPASIPRWPQKTYLNSGWINWGDWLGTNSLANTAKDFLDYEQSKKVMAKMKLSSGTDWRALRAKGLKPINIPVNPDIYYLDKGWISWGDWLGTGRVANSKKNHLSYTEAKSIVQKLELKSELEWRAWKKLNSLPDGVPAKPETVYKNKGWVGFADFLGVSQESRFLSYEDAKKAIKKFNFKSIKEFEMCQKNGQVDSKIPANPYNYYMKSNEWKSFIDFLGK